MLSYDTLQNLTHTTYYFKCSPSVLRNSNIVTGWTVRGSSPGEDEVFLTRPDRSWIPLSLIQCIEANFPGGKAVGAWRGFNHPPPSSAEVKERVELHHSPIWAFVVCFRANFTFTMVIKIEIKITFICLYYNTIQTKFQTKLRRHSGTSYTNPSSLFI
jgi:hypothetical protein